MVHPIAVFGNPALRVEATPVKENSEDLQSLIDDMIETMRGAAGIGLAATQIARTERVFVLDLGPMADTVDLEKNPEYEAYLKPTAFINPTILQYEGDYVEFDEGCLSMPELREIVERVDTIKVQYLDRDFNEVTVVASGLLCRAIQHEFDHLNGVLFTDRVSALKKKLLKRRLRDFSRGKVEAEYPLIEHWS